MDSLGAAVTLWAAVRPRTQELAASGSANKVVRLGGLVDKLAPHFQPLANAALLSRDPDRWVEGAVICAHIRLAQTECSRMACSLLLVTALRKLSSCGKGGLHLRYP